MNGVTRTGLVLAVVLSLAAVVLGTTVAHGRMGGFWGAGGSSVGMPMPMHGGGGMDMAAGMGMGMGMSMDREMNGAMPEGCAKLMDMTGTDASMSQHGAMHSDDGMMMSQAVADLLGLDRQALIDAVHGGTSLAQLAEEKGVAKQELLDTIMASASSFLAARVEDGTLTQEQADEMLRHMSDNAASMIEQPLSMSMGTGHEQAQMMDHGAMGGSAGHSHRHGR